MLQKAEEHRRSSDVSAPLRVSAGTRTVTPPDEWNLTGNKSPLCSTERKPSEQAAFTNCFSWWPFKMQSDAQRAWTLLAAACQRRAAAAQTGFYVAHGASSRVRPPQTEDGMLLTILFPLLASRGRPFAEQRERCSFKEYFQFFFYGGWSSNTDRQTDAHAPVNS